jgi:NADH-quinone oxidoreductase subunit N
MTPGIAIALLPFLILFGAPILLLLLIALKRSYSAVGGVSLLILVGAFVSIFPASRAAPRPIPPLLVLDGFTYFFLGLVVAAGFVIGLLSLEYFRRLDETREEFFVLFLLAILGAAVLVASRHLVSFFLGLEILSVSLYALMAYPRSRAQAVEAGLKYLVLAAVSVAFLLFGFALLYAVSGTMDFAALASLLGSGRTAGPLGLAAMALIIVGVGFKLALVPFHMWTPDIYQGSPAPVTAFVASISKGAMFALLLRFFALSGGLGSPSLRLVFSLVAGASMFAGNLLALRQENVKRLLAYSSIAHLGYLLVAFLASGPLGFEAAGFYLAAYFVTIIGAFGVVILLSPTDRDAYRLEDYAGLFWRRPAMALVFTAMLLSLAGIPLTAGFVGKFYLVAAGAGSRLWALVVILIVNSVLSLYYYLRVIVSLYSRPPAEPVPARPAASGRRFVLAGGLALAFLIIALVWLGLLPMGLIETIRNSVLAFVRGALSSGAAVL